MPRSDDSTLSRAWYVLAPVALILLGGGCLALAVAAGAMHKARNDGSITDGTNCSAMRAAPVVRVAAADAGPWLSRADWKANSATGSSYAAIPVQTWREAQGRAANLGGRLVTVDNAAEQAWLVETFGGSEPRWIGLTDANTEGAWRWAGGEAVSYENWAADEPNDMYDGEHFGVMNWRAPGAWNDMNAASAAYAGVRSAIIERPTRVTPVGNRPHNRSRSRFDISGAAIFTDWAQRESALPTALTFNAGLGEWERWFGPDRVGNRRGVEIVWDDDRASDAIQFTCAGGAPGGNQVGIARGVRINVADYDDVRLSVDVKPMLQSLVGGQWDGGSGYPVTVELGYLDQYGAAHRWEHGFYMNSRSRYSDSSKIPAKQWHSYTSPPLSSLKPICASTQQPRGRKADARRGLHRHDATSRPAVITRVALYGGGFIYMGRSANLRFHEAKLVTRAR